MNNKTKQLNAMKTKLTSINYLIYIGKILDIKGKTMIKLQMLKLKTKFFIWKIKLINRLYLIQL